MLPQRSQMEKHEPSRLITQPASPSSYVPDGFPIDAAERVPKSSDKMRNRRPFRYTAAPVSLTVQPPSLPPLSRSAHLVAAVQKGSASTDAKIFMAGVENRAFAWLKILCLWNTAQQQTPLKHQLPGLHVSCSALEHGTVSRQFVDKRGTCVIANVLTSPTKEMKLKIVSCRI